MGMGILCAMAPAEGYRVQPSGSFYQYEISEKRNLDALKDFMMEY